MHNSIKDRENLLVFMYRETRGIPHHNVSEEEMAAHFEWDSERLEAARGYLVQKGLLKGFSLCTWVITAEGVDRAEEILNLTPQSSSASPAVVINGPISGQLQIGNHNQATQTNNNAPSGELVASIVSALRDSGPISPPVERYIALLESPNPAPQEVTNATGKIAGLSQTYRDILSSIVQQAAGGAAATGLVKAIEIGLKVIDHYI